MNNKTRLIDLNVGQLKQLLSGFELPVKPAPTTYRNRELEIIEEFFLPNTAMGNVEMLTCTQIIQHIQENSQHRITNLKYFGRELKAYFGKPIQKRNVGYLYFIIKRNSEK